jgi:hypothetical protein
MGIIYTKRDQGRSITTGTGVPTHDGVAGDGYTDSVTGNTYQYTTSWQTSNSISSSTSSVYYAGTGLTLSGSTFSVVQSTDVRVTGGSYSIGTTIFTNNIGGTFSVDGYYAPYELKNYSGSTFGEKLQTAIDSVPSGVTIDCNDTDGISLQIDISINITKPVTILLGNNLITADVGLGNNVFNILSSSVTIKGVSSSAKSSDLGGLDWSGRTRITMSSGSWHIYSVGYNLLRFEDFDLIGVRSTEYRYDSGTTSLKTAPYSFNNDGSGGIFVAEGDPYVVGGGNTVSKLLLQNLFIYQTMNSGILILGGITSRIENCRISSAAGHGIYIGSSTTTMTLINNYVSSAMLAGICLDGVATSVLISNATEYAGIGLWLKSCQSVEVVGHYSEACGTRDTTRMPDNTGYFINNSLGGQYISDIGTDNLTIFKGASYVITGGRNIYLPNPYSNNPGTPNSIGASTTTRHILIRGSVREIYLLNPRCASSVGYGGTPRFDIGIETLNTDIPRDVNLFFNPSLDGTITPTIAGKYITQTNSSGESTVVLDQGSNTRIQSGATIWSYDTVLRTVITGTTYTTLPNDRMIVVSALTASIAVTLLTPPSGGNVIYTFNDESGSVDLSKKIILSAQSSKTIDGLSSFDLITTPYGYGSVYYNGTNWNVLDNVIVPTGATGATGATGPTGATGSQGDVGATGSTPTLKTVNYNSLVGSGNVDIPTPRGRIIGCRSNSGSSLDQLNFGNILLSGTPQINVSILCEASTSGYVRLYASPTYSSIVGATLIGQYSFTASSTSSYFKRTLFLNNNSGSTEDGSYDDKYVWYVNSSLSILSDEAESGSIATTMYAYETGVICPYLIATSGPFGKFLTWKVEYGA